LDPSKAEILKWRQIGKQDVCSEVQPRRSARVDSDEKERKYNLMRNLYYERPAGERKRRTYG
jgi:hypothetical protein